MLMEGMIIVGEKEFLGKLAELMDTEQELTMDTELDNIDEWDSLSYVAFLAMCATYSDKKIAPSDVKNAKTIRELYSLFSGEK